MGEIGKDEATRRSRAVAASMNVAHLIGVTGMGLLCIPDRDPDEGPMFILRITGADYTTPDDAPLAVGCILLDTELLEMVTALVKNLMQMGQGKKLFNELFTWIQEQDDLES